MLVEFVGSKLKTSAFCLLILALLRAFKLRQLKLIVCRSGSKRNWIALQEPVRVRLECEVHQLLLLLLLLLLPLAKSITFCLSVRSINIVLPSYLTQLSVCFTAAAAANSAFSFSLARWMKEKNREPFTI